MKPFEMEKLRALTERFMDVGSSKDLYDLYLMFKDALDGFVVEGGSLPMEQDECDTDGGPHMSTCQCPECMEWCEQHK